MAKKTLDMTLTDPGLPIEQRVELLKQLCQASDEMAAPILNKIIEAASQAKSEDQFREKTQELQEMIAALQAGPLRPAVFDGMLDHQFDGTLRAQVILSDGTTASPMLRDEAMAEKMRCGHSVWIDAKGSMILYHAATTNFVGEEAILERELSNGTVEVTVGEINKACYRASARLLEQLDSGEAESGSTIVVCPRRMMAFIAIPAQDGPGYYKYLSDESVPDVVVERDLGAPPAFIGQNLAHLRRELEKPEIGRRYRMRRSKLQLLSGIPGSGKTYGIDGFWNGVYRLLAEMIGVEIEDLPPRVMRLRSSDVLSKWLGDSDKHLARFFEEVEQLARETFEGPDGRIWELPVLVIAEEIDALARARGSDSVHDRILVTLLEGLDPSRSVFRERLVFVLATTNTSHLVDTAVIRRIGGKIHTFGHMDRFSFRAVLGKLLRDIPFRTKSHDSSKDADAARERTVADATAWLYGPNSTAGGQVEVTYAGHANAVTKYHRDFLTAGLLDRAVQEAVEIAANEEHAGAASPGLTAELVTGAINRQVRHIVDLLCPGNCGEYLALPDGERVATVRRLAAATAIPFELERAS